MKSKKAIFFDRDGTIISEKEFVDSINKIKFIDQFLKFINKIKKKI